MAGTLLGDLRRLALILLGATLLGWAFGSAPAGVTLGLAVALGWNLYELMCMHRWLSGQAGRPARRFGARCRRIRSSRRRSR